ncbi:HMA2 domain-containing protein [uncultured Nostoc sp.]|uniref:HMA2 domain-containing protein n=1 Tax=uncultured Nostoc sp. TaxID=340711 RepID=UPI0035CC6090
MTKNINNREKLNIFAKISPNLISTPQSNEVNQSTSKAIAQPSGALQIVHITTGRVRLRTTDSSLNSILDNIAQDLRSLEGVREVAVNEQTGSLVVNFDEDKLSLPQILALKSDIDIQLPQASSDSPSKTDPFAAWKSPLFWKEQGISLIPMMTGLAVTGGLGIHGWVSIPVYMIAADATRGVIGYLGSQVATSEKNEGNYTSSAIKSDIKSESTIQPENSKVVAPAKIDYSVVHKIPGRIRLNVPKIAQDRAYGRRLERIVKTDAQVTSVRVNFDAASIAIAYQSRDIPLSYWVSLMESALETNPPTLGITTAKPLEEVSQTPEITDATTTNHTNPVTQTAEITDATTLNHTNPVTQTAEVINSTTANQTTPELSNLWTNLKSPAMSLSLGIMANLPLGT